jgi:hypothetical protein
VSLFPPPVIAAAIAAGLAMSLLLLILGWGPTAWRPPGRRFKTSVVAGWILWVVICLVLPRSTSAPLLDWLAGAAVLVAATLLTINAWSLAVYGVTLNMLVTLANSNTPLDPDEWAGRFSGGHSVNQICLDRLGHLFFFGLACRQADTVHLVPRSGPAAVAILKAVNFIFGLGRPHD